MAYPPLPPDQSDRRRRQLLRTPRPRLPKVAPPHLPVIPPAPTGATSPAIHGLGSWNLASAAQAVNEQIDPLLKNAADQYNQQAGDISSQMGSLSNQYADLLSGAQGAVHGIYQGPIDTLNRTSGGVKSAIRQAGDQGAAALAASNAQAGQAANAQGSDLNLGSMGAGSSEAAYALGQAMVAALRRSQGAAENYAGQLPGLAREEGSQQASQLLQALSKDFAQQIADITAQAPTRLHDLYNEYQDRQAQQQQQYDQRYGTPFEQKQYADKQRADRNAAVGPQAPTNAGRRSYWQQLAQQRSKDTGDVYVATTTGIRPADADPKKPGIQKIRTETGRAADSVIGKRNVDAATSKARVKIAQQGANTASTRATETARHNKQTEATASRNAQQAQTRENDRHAEAQARIATAQKNATTAAQRAALAKRAQKEKERHNRATETISRSKKKTAAKTTVDPTAGNYGPK